MLRTTSLAPVLVLLAASPALAAEIRVTDFTDDPKAPAAGSFRALVATAQPGDVVVLDRPLVIPLAADLNIDRTGVTIRGPGGFQRASSVKGTKLPQLRVRGGGVVFDNLDLRDVLVTAEPATTKGRLAGFRATNCRYQGRGGFSVSKCDGAVFEDLTMSLDNTGGKTRSSLPAILDIGGVGTRVERCDIANLRGVAYSGVETTGLTMRGGRMNADVSVAPGLIARAAAGEFEPGETLIDDVDFTTRRLKIVPSRSRPTGPVRVIDSEAGRVRVSGAKVEFLRNTVKLPDDDPLFAVDDVVLVTNANLKGPMLVEGNTLRGGYNGLAVECFTSGADCTVSGNLVEDAANIALRVTCSDPCVVSGNTVTGGLTLGVSIGMALGGDSRDMDVVGNTVSGTGGEGIRILQEIPGIVLRDNILRDNAESGIFVQEDAIADIRGGTVERCGLDADSFGGGDAGIVFGIDSRGSVEGTTLRDNHGPGIYVWRSGAVRMSRLVCSGNGGPGIDIERPGPGFLTSKRTAPPFPKELAFDEAARAVTGTAFAGAFVEVYRVEDGARTGNPANGEGAAFLADGTAGSDGKFSVPVNCSPGDLLTVTVTRLGARPATTEFSTDIECKGQAIEVVSVSSAGAAGDGESGANLRALSGTRPSISSDGRYVVFESVAGNLTADARGSNDVHVFLRDTESGTTTRVTRAASGSLTPGAALNGLVGITPSISEDGRFVAYVTTSEEIISGASGGNYPYTVLFDRENGTTVAVSDPIPRPAEDPFPSGQFTKFGGDDASISGDGSTVAFVSIGRDWVSAASDLDFDKDLFVWTRATGAVERVSVPTGGGDVASSTFFGPVHPRLSRDGRYVVFSSFQDLTGNAGAPSGAVYLRDRIAGTTEAVSLDAGGVARTGETPQVSSDGRYVVFATTAALVATDTDGRSDIYLRDRQLNTTTRLSLRSDMTPFPAACIVPTMSSDGRFVAFQTQGQFVVPDGPTVGNIAEIHLRDRNDNTIAEASIGISGEAFGAARAPCLSADGRALLFQSVATNLVPAVTGSVQRLQSFLRRL